MEAIDPLALTAHTSHFNALIKGLAQQFAPLQIYSFWQHSTSQQTQGCFGQNQTSLQSDYALLVLTVTATRIDYAMQEYANTHYQQGNVSLIGHSRQQVMAAVQQGDRFFTNILRHGQLLYSKAGLLNNLNLTPFAPAATHANTAYKQHLPLAHGFLHCAATCLNNQQYAMVAFMLHQVVEQACICIIRVCLGYQTAFHNLYRLLRLCRCFAEAPFKLFLANANDERLFAILAKSYGAARYNASFLVTPADAETLYQRCHCFLAMAKALCLQQLTQLRQAETPNALLPYL